MAKKRKKDKKQEEEYEFKPPEFNEREFLEKEIRDTRAAIVTVGVAILFGVVAGVITALGSWLVALAFIVGIGGIFSLKFVYTMISVDVSAWTKKNWAGTIVVYFMTFLAIWVLAINTPFVDMTKPGIEDLTVWVDNGTNVTGIIYDEAPDGQQTWLYMESGAKVSDAPASILSTYGVNITARISDSGGIAVAEISVGNSPSALMTKGSSGMFEHLVPGSSLSGQSVLSFSIHAEDEHGNERTLSPGPITIRT